MNPDQPNKFTPTHHQPFPGQPIDPDPESTAPVPDEKDEPDR